MDDKVIVVLQKHIEAGIKKYNGVIDSELQNIFNNSEYDYTPYIFSDGRILLVLPNNISALLYPNKQILFEKIDLKK